MLTQVFANTFPVHEPISLPWFGTPQKGLSSIWTVDIIPKPKVRRLKANWTLEVADDLKAIHGLEAEAELHSTNTDYDGEFFHSPYLPLQT